MRRLTWSVLVFVPLLVSASIRAEERAPSDEEPIYRGKAAISLVVSRLQSSDPKKRVRLCILLADFGPLAKEAIPALEKMASEDSEKGLRLVAYTALAKIDPFRLKDTVRRLSDALSSKRLDDVVLAAFECLEELGPDARDALPALRALRERLKDKDEKDTIGELIKKIENPKKDPGKR